MKATIRTITLSFATVALLALTGCSSGTGTEAAAAAAVDGPKPILRVSGFDPVTAELAERSGIWDDAPYTIEPSALRFSEAAAALQSDQVDLGYFAATTSLLLQANGGQDWTAETTPIKVVAGYAPPRSVGAVIVRSDSGIDTPADLEGKTIAWSAADNGLWLASLESAGLGADDVEAVESPDGAALLRAGSVDAVSTAVQQVADLISSGEAKVIQYAGEVKIPFYPQWAVRSEDLADPEQEALIHDFITRYNEFNTSWWDSNEETVKEVQVEVGQQSQAFVDFNFDRRLGTYPIAYDESLFEGVGNTVAIFTKLGILPAGGIGDVTVTYDPRYGDELGAQPYSWTEQ